MDVEANHSTREICQRQFALVSPDPELGHAEHFRSLGDSQDTSVRQWRGQRNRVPVVGIGTQNEELLPGHEGALRYRGPFGLGENPLCGV
jgi:hypothetical protein